MLVFCFEKKNGTTVYSFGSFVELLEIQSPKGMQKIVVHAKQFSSVSCRIPVDYDTYWMFLCSRLHYIVDTFFSEYGHET